MKHADRFPIQVHYSQEDEGYIATAPDIPGSSAFGDTHEAAVRELKVVIALALDAIQKAGNPLPEPSSLNDVGFSGKVLLRMPKSMHAKLAHRAKQDGSSLNQYINLLLVEESTRQSFEDRRAELKALLASAQEQNLMARRHIYSAFNEIHIAKLTETITTTPNIAIKRWVQAGIEPVTQHWSDDGETFNLAEARPHVPVLRK